MAVKEIDIDDRGRTSLKAAGVKPGRYRITTRNEETFVLEVVQSFTRTEMAVLADPEVRAAHQAIKDSPELFSPSPDLP